ncbi:MAG: bifunctional hydroxymethylpyrimidine kinase/phosphomethylpyrimidine kinase, partial [Rhizobium sp.]|nr:bifunctional hydroxymethylpyrimidine kinase/phosphomethylpyrimidine kinase [Rhizobium sp.]
ELAKGSAPAEAVAAAKAWIAGAVAAAGDLSVGTGHGPIHHFHALWNTEGNTP